MTDQRKISEEQAAAAADNDQGGEGAPPAREESATGLSGRVVWLKTSNAQEDVLDRVRRKLEGDELRPYSRAKAAHRAFVTGLRALERELDGKVQ